MPRIEIKTIPGTAETFELAVEEEKKSEKKKSSKKTEKPKEAGQ